MKRCRCYARNILLYGVFGMKLRIGFLQRCGNKFKTASSVDPLLRASLNGKVLFVCFCPQSRPCWVKIAAECAKVRFGDAAPQRRGPLRMSGKGRNFGAILSAPRNRTFLHSAASVTMGSFDTFAAHCIYDRFGDLGSNCMIFATA